MMNRNSLNRWVAINTIIVTVLLPLVLLSFQNCAPKSFSTSSNDSSNGVAGTPDGGGGGGGGTPTPTPGSTPVPGDGFALQDEIIHTSFNTAVNFSAQFVGNRANYTYSFDIASNLSSLTIANVGTVQVTDASTWALKFTPIFGYRGETIIWVYARKTDGTIKQAQLTLDVGNAVNLLAPALAVRATGCVTCHAEVHSNMVTDFGFGGDGASRNYYFGQMLPSGFSWNDGMPYGDYQAFQQNSDGTTSVGAWATLDLVKVAPGQGQKVYIPAGATVPSAPAAASGTSTLKSYIQNRLTASSNSDSALAAVIEKGTVYIGAPTASRLKSVFNWGGSDLTQKYKYIPDAWGAALSGMNVTSTGPANGKYFTNTGTVVCEGDLMLDGTVYLNNLNLQTHSGCRLYVTGTVFIYGPINYIVGSSGDYSNRNLQITSSKAVMMGLGSLWKNGVVTNDGAHDSNHCEYNSASDAGYWEYYKYRSTWTSGMTPSQVNAYNDAISDSAKYRLTYFWGLPAFYQRSDTRTGDQIGLDIYNEMQSTIGAQLDAACRPETRDVAYSRLLLNAPLVESRYTGGFSGSIIAEVSLMSLGLGTNNVSRFEFQFDSVFQNVSILPLLQDQDFLQVQ